jgi:hypothetical protein
MPAVSKAQRRFFGIVKSIKSGKTKPSYSSHAAKAARTMSMKSVRHYAKTKERGLPLKVKRQ